MQVFLCNGKRRGYYNNHGKQEDSMVSNATNTFITIIKEEITHALTRVDMAMFGLAVEELYIYVQTVRYLRNMDNDDDHVQALDEERLVIGL